MRDVALVNEKVHRLPALHAYIPQREDTTPLVTKAVKKPLYPQVGDVVRYYDLDGGKKDGQILVGRIVFIQKSGTEWIADLLELDDTGDGYFSEYPSRRGRTTVRRLVDVSPIAASFVRSENAYKVPWDRAVGTPLVKAHKYDLEGYVGPFAGANAIDMQVVRDDAVLYANLKDRLLRSVALVGLVGTAVAEFFKGTEDALIYFAGVLASLAYLILLSVKTDTMAKAGSKFGSNLANLRFFMPLVLLVGVAVYNQSLGEANPVRMKGVFDYVTTEQFAAAMVGFLTYRIPLFVIQIQDAFRGENETTLPGSAGVALQLAQQTTSSNILDSPVTTTSLPTVLVVSGPQATGRSRLVKRFVNDDKRFVSIKCIDRRSDPASFERIMQRGEFVYLDDDEQSGLTKASILKAARDANNDDSNSVVVIDANVDFCKKLTQIPGLRLVGVWIGLNSAEEFERRLAQQIDDGLIPMVDGDTPESILRAKMKDVVREIEYGISSGVFEFTIFNEDEEISFRQLREAAEYCFK